MSTSLIPPSLPPNDYQPWTLEEEEAHVRRIEELYQTVVEKSVTANELQQEAVEKVERARHRRVRFYRIVPAALGVTILALLVVVYYSTISGGQSLSDRFADGALNLATEVIGVIITLLLIEWRLQRLEREESNKKSQAIQAIKNWNTYEELRDSVDSLLKEAREQLEQRKQELGSAKTNSNQ